MVSKILFNHFSQRAEPYEYIAIPVTYFRKTFGSHFQAIRDRLISSGILESTKTYLRPQRSNEGVIEGFCYGFRISQKYLDSEMASFKSKNPKKRTCELTLRTKAHLRELSIPDIDFSVLTDSYLMRRYEFHDRMPYVAPVKITKDGSQYERALTPLDEIGEDELLYSKAGKFYLVPGSMNDFISLKRICVKTSWGMSAELLNNRRPYAHRNETNMRLDSNITNMPSVLLNQVWWNKQRIVEIDLCNSQILILSTILSYCIKNYFNNKKIIYKKWGVVDKKIIYKKSKKNTQPHPTPHPPPYMLLTFLHLEQEGHDLKSSFTRELRQILTNSETGVFFDKKNIYDKNRENFKKGVFRVLFGDPKYRGIEVKNLEKQYPNLVLFTRELKNIFIQEFKREGSVDYRRDGSRQLALILQKFESKVFIDIILKNLYDKNIKALSKHDSIVCRESDVDLVRSIMSEELSNIFSGYKIKTNKN